MLSAHTLLAHNVALCLPRRLPHEYEREFSDVDGDGSSREELNRDSETVVQSNAHQDDRIRTFRNTLGCRCRLLEECGCSTLIISSYVRCRTT